jgi:hypothetical protein
MTTLPIIICDFWRNRRGEAVRIQIREYEGQTLIDCRVHFTNKDGKLTPSHQGLAISIRKLPELVAGLRKALNKARELHLIAAASTTSNKQTGD